MDTLSREKTSSLDIPSYSQLIWDYDSDQKTFWCYLNPKPRLCFTPTLLKEILDLQDRLSRHLHNSPNDVHYFVAASATPQVFNFGGDLQLFLENIRRGDKDTLYRYGLACVNAVYNNAINLNIPTLTTISLVQGSALGGGFEAALSSNVLIAEPAAQLGFPEILFNLFPGMGAYNLLARRTNPAAAERLLHCGKVFSASELYDMGVIDLVVENGSGTSAVRQYIRRHQRSRNGHNAIQKVRRQIHPLDYNELVNVLDIWVDAAMQVTPRDLRTMERLAATQDRIPESAPLSLIRRADITTEHLANARTEDEAIAVSAG